MYLSVFRIRIVWIGLAFIFLGGGDVGQWGGKVKAGNDSLQIRFLAIGDSLFQLHQFDVAMEAFSEAYHPTEGCSICDSLNAQALIQIGRCKTRLGDVKGAYDNYEQAALIAEENGFMTQATRCRINQGLELTRLGEIRRAELAIQRALKIREDLYGPESYEYARALSNLEDVKSLMGDYSACRDLLNQAQDIYRKLGKGTSIRMGIAFGNEAQLLIEMAKDTTEAVGKDILLEAEGLAGKAMEIFEAHPRGMNYYPAMYEIWGDLKSEDGDQESAVSYYLKVDSFFEVHAPKLRLRDRAKPLANLGKIYLEQGRFSEAEATFLSALEQFGGGFTIAGEEAYLEKGINEKADPYLLIPYEGISRTLLLDGSIRKGDQKAIGRAFGYIDLAINLADTLGEGFHDPEDRDYLAGYLHQWMSTALSICLLSDSLFPESGYRERALDYIEKTRSFSLKLKLQDLNASRQFYTLEDVFEREVELRNDIAKGKILLDTDPEMYNEYHLKLAEWDQELRQLREEHFPEIIPLWEERELADTRGFLKQEGAGLVEYLRLGEKWMALVIVADEVYTIPLECPGLEEMVQGYIDVLKTSPIDRDLKFDSQLHTGGVLYQCLLEPVVQLPEMQTVDKLIVIPDEVLSHLPFGCLISEGGLRDDPREPRYFVEDMYVSYAWSRSMIEPWKASSRDDGVVLALGRDFAERQTRGSDFGNSSVESPLPNVEDEMDEIGQLVKTIPWFNEAASEKRFKQEAQPYRVLHFATHGRSDADDPELSVLRIASDGQEDGFLHSFEISGMDLEAELVVLSACETAEGVFKGGEGVMSLARAFAYAGCPSAIASHWNVNDEVAPELMGYFYSELSEGRKSSEALALAKRKLIDQGKDPFYWGGFVLQGVDSSVQLERSNRTSLYWYIIVGGVVLTLLLFVLRRRFKKDLA